MLFRLIILITMGHFLVACTSMYPMDHAATDVTAQLEVGDHLVVHEKNGRVIDMTLTMIDGEILRGALTQSSLTPVEVNVHDISKLEIEKVSGAKTIGAVVGGVVLLPVFVLGMAMSGA